MSGFDIWLVEAAIKAMRIVCGEERVEKSLARIKELAILNLHQSVPVLAD